MMRAIALTVALVACPTVFAQETKQPATASCAVTRVIGSSVKDMSGKTVADVSDVLIQGNAVWAYVLGVGGFLGVGEERRVAAASAITTTYGGGRRCDITTSYSLDEIKKLPLYAP